MKISFVFKLAFLFFVLLGKHACELKGQNPDSLIKIQAQQIVELQHVIKRLEDKLDQNLINDQAIGTTANNIIAWSGWSLTIVIFVIGAGAWFTGNRFNEIEKIRKNLLTQLKKNQEDTAREMSVLADMRVELGNVQQEFLVEREKALKVISPLLEGQWYYYQGDADQAIQAYREAYAINPNEGQAQSRLAKLLMERGDIPEAIALLNELIDKNSDDYWLYTRLGQAYRRAGDYELAEKAYRTVLEKDEKFWHGWYGLGRVYMVKRDFTQAEIYMKRGVNIFMAKEKKEPSWMLLNLSLVQHCLGKENESKRNGEAAFKIHEIQIKRTPKNPKIHANIGIYYLMKKEWKQALGAFQKVQEVGFPRDFSRTYGIRVELACGKEDNKPIREIKAILQNKQVEKLGDFSFPSFWK